MISKISFHKPLQGGNMSKTKKMLRIGLATLFFASGVGITGCGGVSEEEMAQLETLKSEVTALENEVTDLKSEKAKLERDIAERKAALEKCNQNKEQLKENLKKLNK